MMMMMMNVGMTINCQILRRMTCLHEGPDLTKSQAQDRLLMLFCPNLVLSNIKITPVSGSQSYLKPREQETFPSLDRLGPFGNEASACECSECFVCGVRAKGDCLNWY